MKAWMCWAPGIVDGPPEEVGIYAAGTRGGARYVCLMHVRDAGFSATFADIRVARAPEFDNAEFPQGWMPQYVRSHINRGTGYGKRPAEAI